MNDTITDLETAILGEPIKVDAGNKLALFTLTIRYIGTAFGFLLTVVGIIGKRDWAGLFDLMQSDAVLPALTALVTLGFMTWGAARLVLNKRALVVAAKAAPDSVAVVVASGGKV